MCIGDVQYPFRVVCFWNEGHKKGKQKSVNIISTNLRKDQPYLVRHVVDNVKREETTIVPHATKIRAQVTGILCLLQYRRN